jgi:hypothetical protein
VKPPPGRVIIAIVNKIRAGNRHIASAAPRKAFRR